MSPSKRSVLAVHDDDPIAPIGASALEVCPELPHGTCSTREGLINAELLAFIKSDVFAHPR
jgi:hypothetical protein